MASSLVRRMPTLVFEPGEGRLRFTTNSSTIIDTTLLHAVAALTHSNMVGSLLRKRLNKRQARDDLRSPTTSGGEASSNSNSGTSTPSSEHGSPVAFGDLSGTPPPPPPSGESSVRGASPLRSIMHRYKLRTPAAVAPQVMTGKQQSQSTKDTNSDAGFSEEDDDHSTAPVSDSNTEPATVIDENAELVQTFGEDHESQTASTARPTGKRTKSPEIIPNAITKAGEQLLGIKPADKRRTRSQERRQERADSGTGVQEAEAVEYIKPQGMPKGLTIRKKSAASRTPSFQVDGTTEQKVDNASPGVSPTTSQNFSRPRLQTTQQLINFCRNSASPPDASIIYPSPDHAPASASDDLSISPCHPDPLHPTSANFNFQLPPPPTPTNLPPSASILPATIPLSSPRTNGRVTRTPRVGRRIRGARRSAGRTVIVMR
ncbi:hypothetical protein LTR57_004535 [Friedmanniomyces endolithicus]|nr:hypothetical protein LTR57_004535 [Friedmanniomyces endolithicus]